MAKGDGGRWRPETGLLLSFRLRGLGFFGFAACEERNRLCRNTNRDTGKENGNYYLQGLGSRDAGCC